MLPRPPPKSSECFRLWPEAGGEWKGFLNPAPDNPARPELSDSARTPPSGEERRSHPLGRAETNERQRESPVTVVQGMPGWGRGRGQNGGRQARKNISCCQVFTYPNNFLVLDLLLLFIMAILESIRLYFGTKGNLTEEEAPLAVSLAISVGSVILSVYFLVWQTYVLKADVIINSVLLVTYGLEGILDLIAIAAFVS